VFDIASTNLLALLLMRAAADEPIYPRSPSCSFGLTATRIPARTDKLKLIDSDPALNGTLS
jgi:hypothetical protein